MGKLEWLYLIFKNLEANTSSNNREIFSSVEAAERNVDVGTWKRMREDKKWKNYGVLFAKSLIDKNKLSLFCEKSEFCFKKLCFFAFFDKMWVRSLQYLFL